MITVRYWAGAKAAAGRAEEQLELGSLDELRALLATRPGLDRVAAACSWLIDSEQPVPGAMLREGAVVDVLPPFAGG